MERLHQPIEFKFADSGADVGTFEGYGAYFGNVDSYGDVIVKGAFKDTLRDWASQKRMPPMLVQHGGWMMTDADAIPIGKWLKMEEDSKGLHVKGKLINLDTERGKQIYGAMREGVLDGMSIGYRAKEFTLGTKPDEPRRTLKKIDLIELSIVTFPANDAARVKDVKNFDPRALEDLLRSEIGLSKNDAVSAVALMKKHLREADDIGQNNSREGLVAAELAEAIRRNIATLTAR